MELVLPLIALEAQRLVSSATKVVNIALIVMAAGVLIHLLHQIYLFAPTRSITSFWKHELLIRGIQLCTEHGLDIA